MADEERGHNGIRLIVFDLDGTLVDTFADIAAAANYALRRAGRDPLDVSTVKRHVGHGGRNLMRACLGEGASEGQIEAAFADWRAYYSDHPADFARPYPGVPPTLAALRRRALRLAVVSNKLHELTCAILRKLDLWRFLDAAQGEKGGAPRKPDPELLRGLMARFGCAPRETLMVGDGDADINLARAAGVAAMGVSYGVLSEESLRALGATTVLSEFPQILDFIE